MDNIVNKLMELGLEVGQMVLGAILLWIVGRFVIRMVMKMVDASIRKRLDPTVANYLSSTAQVLLNILLAVAVLSVFGVETTTFAGLLAAGGVAIGMAWSGLLGNFAAGVFLLILRPFKVGDFVTIGGQTGTVQDIGIFVTALDTLENVRVFVGNGKVLGDVISNFSTNGYRRVDCFAQLNHGDDAHKAIDVLRAALAKVPNVESSPAPDLYILEFNLAGPKLCVRPYTNNEHYWDVYFETNRIIRDELGAAGFKVPAEHIVYENPARPNAA